MNGALYPVLKKPSEEGASVWAFCVGSKLGWPFMNMHMCAIQDGKETLVKEVFPGDSVHSLLSILDVITVGLCSTQT